MKKKRRKKEKKEDKCPTQKIKRDLEAQVLLKFFKFSKRGI
jgi:hypothetical protein